MEASRKVIVVTSTPYDETLWVGGTILNNPAWKVFVICLSRAGDAEIVTKFNEALTFLTAEGTIGSPDNRPDQKPIPQDHIMKAILNLWPEQHIDIVIIPSPRSKSKRHKEIGEAMIALWRAGRISANILRIFASKDASIASSAKPIPGNEIHNTLSESTLDKKRYLAMRIYGYKNTSVEVTNIGNSESFWSFTNPFDAEKWLNLQKNTKPGS